MSGLQVDISFDQTRAQNIGRVVLSVKGSAVITAGSPSSTRIFSVFTIGADSKLSLVPAAEGESIVEGLTAQAVSVFDSNYVIVAANNFISGGRLNELVPGDVLHTAETTCRALASKNDGSMIVFGEDNGHIQFLKRPDNWDHNDAVWTPYLSCSLPSSIKSISIDPQGEFAAVSCIDGKVSILSFYTGNVLTDLPNPKVADTSAPEVSVKEFPVSWHPSGNVLAYGSSKGISLVHRESWLEHSVVASSSSIQCLAWSPNGRYLVSVDESRIIQFYDTVPTIANEKITSLTSLSYCKLAEPLGNASTLSTQVDSDELLVTSIGFGDGVLIVGDASGAVYSIPLDFFLPSVAGGVSSTTEPVPVSVFQESQTQVAPPSQPSKSSSKSFGVRPKDAAVPAAPAAAAVAAEAVEELDFDITAEKRRLGFEDKDSEDEDGVEDGLGGGVRQVTSTRARTADEALDEALSYLRSGENLVRALPRIQLAVSKSYGLSPLQPPFQSGSSAVFGPLGDRLRQAFLVWNGTGSVVSRVDSAGNTSIDVEFSDSSMRALRFEDKFRLSVAAMGSGGVLLGSAFQPGDRVLKTEPQPAVLLFRGVASGGDFGSSTTWTVELPIFDPSVEEDTLMQERYWPLPRSFYGYKGHYMGFGSQNKETAKEDEENGYDEDLEISNYDPTESATKEGKKSISALDVLLGVEEDVDEGTARKNRWMQARTHHHATPLYDSRRYAESPLSLAVGEKFVVALTDQDQLRLFSHAGLQGAVIPLPGRGITVAARGALVAAAYHSGMPYAGRQCISVALFRVSGDALGEIGSPAMPVLLSTSQLPLGEMESLEFLDFAENGQLAAVSSFGNVLLLAPAAGMAWTLAVDLKASVLANASTNANANPLVSVNRGSTSNFAKLRNERVWVVSLGATPASALSAVSASKAASTAATAISSFVSADGTATVVFGVTLKGRDRSPKISTPLPLQLPIPLLAPLVETGMSVVDAAYLSVESARAQRRWQRSNGLTAASTDLRLNAALTAAADVAKGITSSATGVLMRLTASEQRQEALDGTAIDRLILKLFKKACEDADDSRAVHLGLRLHSARALDLAAKIAAHCGRGAVGERIIQLGLLADVQVVSNPSNTLTNNNANSSNSNNNNNNNSSGTSEGTEKRMESPSSSKSNDDTNISSSPAEQQASKGFGNSNNASTTSSGSKLTNPFARKTLQSPGRKRERELNEVSADSTPSPQRLSRQSTISTEARAQRLRELQNK